MLIFTFAKHSFPEMFVCDHSTSRVHCVRDHGKGGLSSMFNKGTGHSDVAWVFISCSYASDTWTSWWFSTWHAFFSLRPSHMLSDLSWMHSPSSALLTPSSLQNSTWRTTFPEMLSDFPSTVPGCQWHLPGFPSVLTEPHRHTSNTAFILLIRDKLHFLAHLFIRPWAFQGRFSLLYML